MIIDIFVSLCIMQIMAPQCQPWALRVVIWRNVDCIRRSTLAVSCLDRRTSRHSVHNPTNTLFLSPYKFRRHLGRRSSKRTNLVLEHIRQKLVEPVLAFLLATSFPAILPLPLLHPHLEKIELLLRRPCPKSQALWISAQIIQHGYTRKPLQI